MRTVIALYFLSCTIPCAAIQNPRDFDRQLSTIAEDFKEVIMDEDECEELKDKAEYISKEIEELLEESEGFSSEEILQLEQLKTEAEGIEDFIAVVAGVGSAVPKVKDFIRANERMGVGLYYISQEEYCVDILVVEIDEYVTYLASNNSNKSFRLNFEWKTKDKSSFGSSKVGMSSKTIRSMLNNRDYTLKNNIDFKNIECIEFKKWGEN